MARPNVQDDHPKKHPWRVTKFVLGCPDEESEKMKFMRI